MFRQDFSIPGGSLPTDLKLSNRHRILNVFRSGLSYTANDISMITGISRQTVMKAISFFQEKGLIVSAGMSTSTSTGGKKAGLYSFSTSKFLLSITLWPHTLRLTLFTLTADQIAQAEYPCSLTGSINSTISSLQNLSEHFLASNRIQKADLYAVGLSTAGTVDYSSGLLRYSSLSPQWGTNIPLRKYLQDIFPQTPIIYIENAGKMAGRAELATGRLSDKRVLTFFTTWGVSACFIDSGHIVDGNDSLIGEVGHMSIDPHDKELCGCGSHGCLERLVSIQRLQKIIAQRGKHYPHSLLTQQPVDSITLEDVFRGSAQQDRFCRVLVTKLANYFALAIRNITLVFDPEVIIFQGDYANADSYFDTLIKKELSSFQYYLPSREFDIRYDSRPLYDLDAIGAAYSLSSFFFNDRNIYM